MSSRHPQPPKMVPSCPIDVRAAIAVLAARPSGPGELDTRSGPRICGWPADHGPPRPRSCGASQSTSGAYPEQDDGGIFG
jgi:hypothetical protein